MGCSPLRPMWPSGWQAIDASTDSVHHMPLPTSRLSWLDTGYFQLTNTDPWSGLWLFEVNGIPQQLTTATIHTLYISTAVTGWVPLPYTYSTLTSLGFVNRFVNRFMLSAADFYAPAPVHKKFETWYNMISCQNTWLHDLESVTFSVKMW
jgi:hypothetical protein